MAINKAKPVNEINSDISVLRIGVVRDRQLCHEQLLELGESFTIGHSALNTFVMAPDSCPSSVGERFTLFEYAASAYHLQFSSEMNGKVADGDDAADLSSLRSGQTVGNICPTNRKELTSVTLDKNFKGKVEVGEYSFLFQFVSSPSIVMRNTDVVKEPFFEEDDWLFSGLVFFGQVIAIFSWFTIQGMERPEPLTKEEQQRIIADLFDAPPPEPTDEPNPDLVKEDENAVDKTKPADKPKDEPKDEPEKEPSAEPSGEPDPKPNKGGKSVSDLTPDEAAAAGEKVDNSALFAGLTSTGDGASGSTTSAFSSESDGGVDLDKALDGKGNARTARNGGGGGLKGQSDTSGKASGELKTGTTGKTTDKGPVKGPATTVPTSKAKSGTVESVGSCSGGGVKAQVKRKLTHIKACHDVSLKANANVKGRVVINMEVQNGKVTMSRVAENSTGDKKLGSCIAGKIKRWKFPDDCNEIATIPFILEPKK